MLILGYGGVGMILGIISADEGQRLQQIWIGLAFLAGALICVVPFVRMFRAGAMPVLLVDETGIWDKRVTARPVPWAAITGIEGIAPGFMERLLMPGSQAGRILIHVAPEAYPELDFIDPATAALHRWLLAGDKSFRILHGAIDARFPLLMDVLLDAQEAAKAG